MSKPESNSANALLSHPSPSCPCMGNSAVMCLTCPDGLRHQRLPCSTAPSLAFESIEHLQTGQLQHQDKRRPVSLAWQPQITKFPSVWKKSFRSAPCKSNRCRLGIECGIVPGVTCPIGFQKSTTFYRCTKKRNMMTTSCWLPRGLRFRAGAKG